MSVPAARRDPAGRSALAANWTLDPATVFLNHGSFGACPATVLAAQTALRAEMEANPVAFLGRALEGRLEAARSALGRFVGAAPDDLAFVPNATHGIATVLRNLRLRPGDEILANDHEYNAALNAAEASAASAGATLRVLRLPLPLAGPEAVVDALLEAVTARTRLVLVSHVTSPTGLVFPVERLVTALEPRGVPVLVDGAHAPGMLPLELARLGASYYTGNLHKWCCAPKGAAFLHVRRDRQDGLRPLAISHGANDPRPGASRFQREFDWTGTSDPTPWLCAPAALDAVAAMLPGSWPAVMAANAALAREARAILLEAVGGQPVAPVEMLGAMAAVALPSRPDLAPTQQPDSLQAVLLERFGIEVPVLVWPRHGAPVARRRLHPGDESTGPVRLVRVSAHLHNAPEDYRVLGAALAEVLAAGG